MADLHKYTSKEVLNKVLYNNTSLNTYSLSEGLNTILDSANDRINIRLEGGTVDGDLTVTGALTVEGATTTIESETVQVADKTFELAVPSSGSATDATSDGGGLILKGTTDKTILWSDANDRWDFNQGISLGSNSLTTTGTVSTGALTVGGNIDFNSGTIDLSTQTVDVTLNSAVDALNFDSNTLSIDASNNRVGIGTASPAESIHTTGNIRFGDSAPAELYTNSSELRLGVDRNNDNATSNITFYTNNDEKVRIDADGSVGIGTTSPDTVLDVSPGATGTTSIGSQNINLGQIVNTTSGRSGITIRTANDYLDASGFNHGFGFIYPYADGVDSDDRSYKAFKVAHGSTLAETFSVDKYGRVHASEVGIGTTSPVSALDLGSATQGKGISWGGTNGTAHYATIWTEYGNGSLIMGAGLKGSTSASTFLNPHTGTYGYAAIELDSFSDDGIKFYVGADSSKTKDASITPSEAMRIDTSGNVGINETSCDGKLHIKQSTDEGNAIVVDSGTSSARIDVLTIQEAGAERWNLSFEGNAATNSLTLNSNSISNIMHWAPDGSVGIGTNSPGIADEGATVTIEDSSSVPTLELSRKSDSISDNAQVGILRFYHGSSTQRMAGQVDMIEDGTSENAADMRFWTSTGGNLGLGMTITSSGDIRTNVSGGQIQLYDQNNTGDFGGRIYYDRSNTKLQIEANEFAGDDLVLMANDQIRFTANGSERMRIDSSGTLIFGNNQYAGHGGAGGSFYPVTDDNNDVGSASNRWDDVYATNGTIQTSDKRMKDDISTSSLGLDFVNQLNPVEYKWKDYNYEEEVSPAVEAQEEVLWTEEDELPEGVEVGDVKVEAVEASDAVFETKSKTFTRKHYGLIAQEVEQVLTDSGIEREDFAPLIYDEDSDRYGMRYGEMVGILIKAVQELSAKVEALENA